MMRFLRTVIWLPLITILAVFVVSNLHPIEVNFWLAGLVLELPAYIVPLSALFIGILFGAFWMSLRK